jgi:hypothetical protein
MGSSVSDTSLVKSRFRRAQSDSRCSRFRIQGPGFRSLRVRRKPPPGVRPGPGYTVHSPISRILFPAKRGDDHFSSRFANEARSRERDATITRGSWSGGRPFPCSVLHHAGFTMPPQLPSERWALTPPFQPYLCPCGPSAVYFLLHFPSGPACTEPSLVFTRHAALWCPDFPRSLRRNENPAIAQGVEWESDGKGGERKGEKHNTSPRPADAPPASSP